jgi:hypothetical protein
MIVVGIHECADRDDGVAAWAVLDHHRLAPARAQPIRQQPRPDIHPRSGAERQQKLDRTLRPSLRRRRHDRKDNRRNQA